MTAARIFLVEAVYAWQRSKRAQASQILLAYPEAESLCRGDVKRLSRKYKPGKTPKGLKFECATLYIHIFIKQKTEILIKVLEYDLCPIISYY